MAVVRGYDYESVRGQRRPKGEVSCACQQDFPNALNNFWQAAKSLRGKEAQARLATPDFASVERTFAKIVPTRRATPMPQ
jgi:hypothetical protein